MSVVRVCCNKELADSCIYCCDGRYCTNEDDTTYSMLDSGCGGYINKEVFRALLKEELRCRDVEEDNT